MSLALAGASHEDTFPSPFDDVAVCGDNAIVSHMLDPNVFVPSAHCDSLCRKAAAACKGFVRRVVSCQIKLPAALLRELGPRLPRAVRALTRA
jgi:hypothetical protein